MTITPAQNGFLKQILMVIVLAVASYLANVANVSPIVGLGVATVVSALASSLESYIRAQTDSGLFGAVRVR